MGGQGNTGATGPMGATGSQGAQGNTGPTGPMGYNPAEGFDYIYAYATGGTGVDTIEPETHQVMSHYAIPGPNAKIYAVASDKAQRMLFISYSNYDAVSGYSNWLDYVDENTGAQLAHLSMPYRAYSLNAVDGKVYAKGLQNQLYVYQETPPAYLTTITGLGLSGIVADPIAFDTCLNKGYIPTENGLFAFDPATNAVGAQLSGDFVIEAAVDSLRHRLYVIDGGSENVSVYDTRTNALIASLPNAPDLYPRNVAVNWATNKIYVMSYNDNTYEYEIQVFDGATQQLESVMPVDIQNNAPCEGVSLSVRENRLYYGYTDGAKAFLRAVDLSTGAVVKDIPVENGSSFGANAHAALDNPVPCAGGGAATGATGATGGTGPQGNTGPTGPTGTCCCNEPAYAYVPVNNKNQLQQIDPITHQVIRTTGAPPTPWAVQMDEKGENMWFASATGLYLYNAKTGAYVKQLNSTPMVNLLYNPLNKKLYTSSNTEISIYDAASGALVATIPTQNKGSGFAALTPQFDQATNTVFFFSTEDEKVLAISGNTNALAAEISVPRARDMALDATRHLLYVIAGNDGDQLLVYDSTNYQLLGTHALPIQAVRIAVNPATNKIYLNGSRNDYISVVDAGTFSETAQIPIGNNLGRENPMTVDTKDNLIYLSNRGTDTCQVIDGASNTVAETLNFSPGQTTVVNCASCCGGGGAIGPTGPAGPTGAAPVQQFFYAEANSAQYENKTGLMHLYPFSPLDIEKNNGFGVDGENWVVAPEDGYYLVSWNIDVSAVSGTVSIALAMGNRSSSYFASITAPAEYRDQSIVKAYKGKMVGVVFMLNPGSAVTAAVTQYSILKISDL